MKTSELIGSALDYAVAKALNDVDLFRTGGFHPSICWNKGGPIIEREKMSITNGSPTGEFLWYAHFGAVGVDSVRTGPTPLIAAMRCFVASKLGDEVDIPKELQ